MGNNRSEKTPAPKAPATNQNASHRRTGPQQLTTPEWETPALLGPGLGNLLGVPTYPPPPLPHGGDASLAVQLKASGPASSQIPPDVAKTRLGSGSPLARRHQEHLGPALGVDLSAVRIHAGSEAADLARDMGARALTVGRDVAFSAGAFQPDSPSGRRLLVHELSHVVQQSEGRVPGGMGGPTLDTALESEADAVAKTIGGLPTHPAPTAPVLSSEAARTSTHPPSGRRVQLEPDPEGITPDIKGKKLGQWKDAHSSALLYGGDPLILADGRHSFESAQEAIAMAIAQLAEVKAEGAVIIASQGRYYLYTMEVASLIDQLEANDIDSGGSQLVASTGDVPGISTFITQDGFAVAPTQGGSEATAGGTQIDEKETTLPGPEAFTDTIEARQAGEDVGLGEEGSLELFKTVVKVEALSRLEENSRYLDDIEAQYDPANGAGSPEASMRWERLREAITKDKNLLAMQRSEEDIAHQYFMDAIAAAGPPKEGIEPSDAQLDKQLRLYEVSETHKNRALAYAQVRAGLHEAIPEVAAVAVDEIDPQTASRGEIYKNMQGEIADARAFIEDARVKIHEGDMPLSKLTPVVEVAMASLAVDAAKVGDDPMSTAVIEWIEWEETKELGINLVVAGTGIAALVIATLASAGTITLSAGALAAVGAGGAATGLAGAAYNAERADDLYDASGVGDAGGHSLLSDPDAALFSLIMSIVDLALSGLDVFAAVKGIVALRKAGATGAQEVLQEAATAKRAEQAEPVSDPKKGSDTLDAAEEVVEPTKVDDALEGGEAANPNKADDALEGADNVVEPTKVDDAHEGGVAPTADPSPLAYNKAIDDIVQTSGGSIKRAITLINSRQLNQADAVETVIKVTESNGRNIGGVASLPDGAKVVTSVRKGPGNPVVHVAPDGKTTFAHADLDFRVGDDLELIPVVTNVTLD